MTTKRLVRVSILALIVLAFLASLGIWHSVAQEASSGAQFSGVWVKLWEPWQQIAGDDNKERLWVSASVLRLCANGKFIRVNCLVYKTPKGNVIGPSDGITIYKGKWATKASTALIEYELAFAEIPMVGKDTREQEKHLIASMEGEKLRFEGELYARNAGFLNEERETDLKCQDQ